MAKAWLRYESGRFFPLLVREFRRMSRWPLNTIYFWQEAPLLRPLLCLVAGIICYDRSWFSSADLGRGIIGLFLCGFISILLSLHHKRSAWLEAPYILCLGLFFSVLGWCSYAVSDVRNQKNWAGTSLDTAAMSVVRIKDDPQQRPATTRINVEWIADIQKGIVKPKTGNALLYIYRSQDSLQLAEGDTLVMPAHWQTIRNGGNLFAFDNAAFQRRKNIFHQQTLAPDDVVVFGKCNPRDLSLMRRINLWARHQLCAYVTDSATIGLLQAMLLGDESGFDADLRQAYSQTGIIHIVSISGSHVAVLFLVVTVVFSWLKGKRGAIVKYLVGLTLVWLYVLMAGAPPSALRSALMFTVIALGGVGEQEGHSLNTVVCAAFALLVAEPAWLFSVGFQLSFAAVLSMLVFYTPIYRLWYWPKKYRIVKWLWAAVSASIAAEILTAPMVIYYFHNFPLLFAFANIIAAIMAGVCALVGGLAIVAFCWIPPLAQLLAWIVTFIVTLFNRCIVWMQDWNVNALQHLRLNALELLLVYLLIIALGVWWLKRNRAGLLLALPVSYVMLIFLSADAYKTAKQERLIVYSNGRQPLVEIIRGNHFETLVGRQDGYNSGAVHTGLGAWRCRNVGLQTPYFSLAGKRILILTDSNRQSYENPLPVDLLIVARPLRQIRISKFLSAFTPKEVVLAVKPSEYHLRRWADSCVAHGIHLHNVDRDGAYVWE